MPQFDVFSFSSQTFWFILSFVFFYFFTGRFYLKYFSQVLKFRNKLTNFSITVQEKANLFFFGPYVFFLVKIL